MEFELKYRVENDETLLKIWEDKKLSEIEVKGSRSEDRLRTFYLDTASGKLKKNKIALRVRTGAGKVEATVKTLVKAEGAYHRREEYNVFLKEFTTNPRPEVFAHLEIGKLLKEVVGEEEVHPTMETDIFRRKFLIKSGECLVELALDAGSVKAIGKEEQFRELELELVSGPEEPLLSLGQEIMGKYNLEPEEISKFERGLRLLGS